MPALDLKQLVTCFRLLMDIVGTWNMINDFVEEIEDLLRLAQTKTDLLRLSWQL